MYHNSGNVVVSNANYQQQAGIVGGGAPIMGPVDPGFQQQMMMSTTPQPPTTVGPANRVMGKGLLIVDGPFFTAAVGGRDVSLDLFVQSIESRVGTLFLDKIYVDPSESKRARMPTFGWQTLDCTPRSSRSEILCPECSFKYNFSGGALDVEIAVTVLDSGAFNDDIQEIVLVVGDGDYYSAVEKAKTKYNKHIWVVHEHETANTRLIALAGARKIPLETVLAESLTQYQTPPQSGNLSYTQNQLPSQYNSPLSPTPSPLPFLSGPQKYPPQAKLLNSKSPPRHRHQHRKFNSSKSPPPNSMFEKSPLPPHTFSVNPPQGPTFSPSPPPSPLHQQPPLSNLESPQISNMSQFTNMTPPRLMSGNIPPPPQPNSFNMNMPPSPQQFPHQLQQPQQITSIPQSSPSLQSPVPNYPPFISTIPRSPPLSFPQNQQQTPPSQQQPQHNSMPNRSIPPQSSVLSNFPPPFMTTMPSSPPLPFPQLLQQQPQHQQQIEQQHTNSQAPTQIITCPDSPLSHLNTREIYHKLSSMLERGPNFQGF